MKEVLSYLQQRYGVKTLGDVQWSHAVNSREKLQRTITDPHVMFVESDIRISSTGEIIAAHPPAVESDLSFDELLQALATTEKGIKLDFKDPEVLVACLEKIKEAQLKQPVLLNADILQGNKANPSKFSAVGFLALCKQLYPQGVLSIGWTTVNDTSAVYTRENIDEMLKLCDQYSVESATFPVRACLVEESWNELQRLINKEGYTLTIWNNEPVEENTQQWIKVNTDPTKTFYDFIDENKEPLRFW